MSEEGGRVCVEITDGSCVAEGSGGELTTSTAICTGPGEPWDPTLMSLPILEVSDLGEKNVRNQDVKQACTYCKSNSICNSGAYSSVPVIKVIWNSVK